MFSPDGAYFAMKGSYPDFQKEQYIEIVSFKKSKKAAKPLAGEGDESSDGGVGGFHFQIDAGAAAKQQMIVERSHPHRKGGPREGWEDSCTYELEVVRPPGASNGGIKSDPGCAFAFMHYAKQMVVGKDTGAVILYDIATGEQLRQIGQMPDWFLSMVIDPTDQHCVCTDYARNLVVFKLDDEGGKQCEISQDARPTEDICSLAFVERTQGHAQNGAEKLVAYLAKDKIYFLDMESGEEVRSFRISISGKGLMWTLHFIRDGRMCVSCNDASVQLWSKVATSGSLPSCEWFSGVLSGKKDMTQVRSPPRNPRHYCNHFVFQVLDVSLSAETEDLCIVGPLSTTSMFCHAKTFNLTRFRFQPCYEDILQIIRTDDPEECTMLNCLLRTFPTIVNCADHDTGNTILHYCADYGDNKLLAKLLAAKTSIGLSANFRGVRESAFVRKIIATSPRAHLLKTLLASEQEATVGPKTALHIAIEKKSKQSVQLLLESLQLNMHANMHIYTGQAVLLLAESYPDLLRDFLSLACFATVPDTVLDGLEAAPISEDNFIVRGSSESAPLSYWKQQLDINPGWWLGKKVGTVMEALGMGEEEGRLVEVEACLLPIADLAAYHGPEQPALLQRFVEEDRAELFDNDVMKAILQFKWETYAYDHFMNRFAVYIAQLLFYTSHGFFPDTTMGIIFGCLGMLVSFRFVLKELIEMYSGTHSFSFNFWYLLDWAVNICGMYAVTLQIMEIPAEIAALAPHPSGVLMSSVFQVLAWGKILYFLLAFEETGPQVKMIIQIVVDIRWFLLILGVIIVGFGGAFHIELGHANPDFNLVAVWFTMFDMMLNGLGDPPEGDSSIFDKAKHQDWAWTLSFAYTLVVTIILLNLLIALMGESAGDVKERSELEFLLGKARIIVQLEEHMAEHPPKFFPRWLHILRPKRPKDCVDIRSGITALHRLHSIEADEASEFRVASIGAIQDLSSRMSALEKHMLETKEAVDAIRRALDQRHNNQDEQPR
jgi:hypothetical protein